MSETPPHALLRPRVAIPFLVVSLIWGSTWFVIVGQIDAVAPQWAVAYRFMIAAPAMFALAAMTGNSLRMGQKAHALALAMGLFQFCGNYTLVYQAERHVTSGVVAILIGLMIVPNAVLGSVILGQAITRRFLVGSAIAIGGIVLLMINEAQSAPIADNVALGAWLGIGAMLAASISNVIQANPTGRSVPLFTLIAWAMLYGVGFDTALAWAAAGPPEFPTSGAFWVGTAYLALAGSVVTFPLYYTLIRTIGAGRAAYHNVLVIVVAMVISTLLEGYDWSLLAGSGALLALFGLVVALRAKSV